LDNVKVATDGHFACDASPPMGAKSFAFPLRRIISQRGPVSQCRGTGNQVGGRPCSQD